LPEPDSDPSPTPDTLQEDPRLNWPRKTVFGMGDFTVNTVLSSMSIVYVTFFLTSVAGLRPELAGAVQLIGRSIDAFTDPAMGRLSDLCRWKLGRRRPFFLLGALPLGITYALLWADLPIESQRNMFLYYTAIYSLMSLALTTLSVPYLALQPEMALGYDARTSLNVYRNAGSIIGVFAAVAFRPVANALGGGPEGFAAAGVVFGVMLALPWVFVFFATWERPEFQSRASELSFRDGAKLVMQHGTFRRLTGMYLCGRVSMDLVGAMLILYFTHWLGRSSDFELMMIVFMGSVLLWLPFWLKFSEHSEKATSFIIGTGIWFVGQLVFLVAQPNWPPWVVLVFAPVVAFGYAVVDLMPWSMLGEVVDEDDLASGERREGVYNGFFMFLRKLAGTIAVFLALTLLGALGFVEGDGEQPERAVHAIRVLTSVGPAVFLALSITFAIGYPLTRERHAEIRAQLEARDAARQRSSAG
jgi:sugar (glycoside-pentoside-hexuronide) transporter